MMMFSCCTHADYSRALVGVCGHYVTFYFNALHSSKALFFLRLVDLVELFQS